MVVWHLDEGSYILSISTGQKLNLGSSTIAEQIADAVEGTVGTFVLICSTSGGEKKYYLSG